MSNIKKDNLTDLVSDVSEPKSDELNPSEANQPNASQAKPQQGLDDYQVVTPDGEVVDLNITVSTPLVQKTKQGTTVKKIFGATDEKGHQYVLIVDTVSS
jgi:hypothetical protein